MYTYGLALSRQEVLPIVRREAAEVALADRGLEQEILDRREAGRQRQFAGRLFLDIGFEDDAVGGAAFLALDFQIFLEITEAVDAVLGALDAEAVERVALVQAEFAAHQDRRSTRPNSSH